jgi:hypothetical protein
MMSAGFGAQLKKWTYEHNAHSTVIQGNGQCSAFAHHDANRLQ